MIDIEQEPDAIAGRPLAKAGLLVLLALLVSLPVTWLLGECGGRRTLEIESLSPVTVSSVGRLELDLYAPVQTTIEQDRAADQQRLTSWGWVDRSARRAHVPLSVAIELYLARREGTR